jgi:hypothetical protein
MVETSTLGNLIGYPYSTYQSLVTRVEPSTMSEMSALVPPMSRLTAFSYPASLAMWPPAMAPAARPEEASLAPKFSATSAVMTPPPECKRSTPPSYPPSRMRLARVLA